MKTVIEYWILAKFKKMMRTRQGHKTKHHIKRTKLDISSSKKSNRS